MIAEKRILARGAIMPFQMVLEVPLFVVVATSSCGVAEEGTSVVAAGLVPPQLLSDKASADMKGSIGSPPQSAATSPIGTFPPRAL